MLRDTRPATVQAVNGEKLEAADPTALALAVVSKSRESHSATRWNNTIGIVIINDDTASLTTSSAQSHK